MYLRLKKVRGERVTFLIDYFPTKQMWTKHILILIETTRQQCSHLRGSTDIFKLQSYGSCCQRVQHSHTMCAPAGVYGTVVTLTSSPTG